MALHKFPKLLKLLDACNVSMNKNYDNNKSAAEMLFYISEKIQEEVMQEIDTSPAIGLMIDESGDNDLNNYLTINIRYLYNNEIKERFCGLLELPSADSCTIFNVLNDFLTKHKLHSKIEAISTDGASVMLGEENGVAIKLKNFTCKKNMVINHCLSHRLNLGAKDIWKGNKYLSNFNNTIHSLCKYFRKSCKKTQILEEEEESILENHLKLIRPLDIRWLSVYIAIEKIFEIYPALISALEIIIEDNACLVAEGLLTRLKSFHFVSLLHIFTDLLTFLDFLNKIFQKENLKYSEACREIKSILNNLERLSSSDDHGSYFSQFIQQNNEEGPCKFHNIELTHLYGSNMESMKVRSKELQKELLDHLKKRFPYREDIEPFKIFDLDVISSIKTDSDRKAYCNDLMETLLKRYRLNSVRGLQEWETFKFYVFNNLQSDREDGIWKFVLKSSLYPNLRVLFEIYLIIPLSTSSCERTFSRMNLIKTELRNRMEPKTLKLHMMVSLNGPDFVNLEEFKIEEAIDLWRNMKPRRLTVSKKNPSISSIQ